MQSRPTHSALASIPNGLNNDWDRWIDRSTTEDDDDIEQSKAELLESVKTLYDFIEAKGDITHLIDDATLDTIGIKSVDEWNEDKGSINKWRMMAEEGLKLASQDDAEGGDEESSFPWEGSSNVHLPLLIQASQHFAARVYPELVRDGDTVQVKVFEKVSKSPSEIDLLQLQQPPQSNDPQIMQQFQQYMQQKMQEAQQKDIETTLEEQARNARGKRVALYLNWYLFYKTQGEWEADTDLLLNQIPITGIAFKKVYMSPSGLKSEYISPLHLTVNKDTKVLSTCPRITQDYTLYPYEILQHQLSDRFRYVELPNFNQQDKENPREIIEQFRLIDLDEDGLPEPYLVTVDVESKTVLRIEPSFGKEDITVSKKLKRISRIEHWNSFVAFQFMPDPRGNFYSTGYAKLLAPLTDSIDTSINQLIDAGTMQVAGGGFIGGDVRFAGTGQAGALTQRPGEWMLAQTTGGTSLKDAIVPMTVPNPSDVTMSLTEILIDSAKDISNIKDVMSGDTATTAPVGTTFAVQQQALTQFTAIYKRVYRGFKEEFRMIYECLRKWATQRERDEYQELTGGNFDVDFSGDGTDIQPVADPTAVTSMQKTARIQALVQFAESAVGQAAGMTQAGPAAEIAKEAMSAWNVERPDRFITQVQPNPMQTAEVQGKVQEMQAKAQDLQATAQLKLAQIKKTNAATVLDQSKAQREIGLSAIDTIELHREADHIAHTPLTTSLNAQEAMDNVPPQPPQPEPQGGE